MKTEIEHLQHLLEKSKVKMQKDFEIWWAEQASQTQSPLSQVDHVWNYCSSWSRGTENGFYFSWTTESYDKICFQLGHVLKLFIVFV